MDHSEKPAVPTPDLAEDPVVDLIQQHLDEATTHELQRKGLVSEPHAPDRDDRHADPLRPADPSTPLSHTPEEHREIL